jgi:type VI secretion system protein ImpK
MREAEDLGEPSALRKLINYYINLFEKNCKAIGMPQDSIIEAKYAIVALIDETVLSVGGACRDYWLTKPMQLDYFGDNIAGEEFYEKLKKIMLQPEKKKDVLEVYFLCLSLGFEGKYKLYNPEERITIMEELGKKIRRTRTRLSAELSPHGRRAEVASFKKEKKIFIPFWITGAIALFCVILGWIIMFVINLQNYKDVAGFIKTLLTN